jgi:HEAT repeat protein
VFHFAVLALSVASQAADDDSGLADLQVLKKAGVPSDNDGLLNFFRRRTLTESDRERIEGLIRDLGNNEFAVRQRASARLVTEGNRAAPFLRKALTHSDLEIRRRAEECLKEIGDQDVGLNVVSAAARLIAARRPAGAAEVLLNFLPFAEDEGSSEDIQPALTAMAIRDGKPDPILTAALKDKDPVRRAGAAVALCQPGATELRPAIHELLRDIDLNVRLRVAMALAAAKERRKRSGS